MEKQSAPFWENWIAPKAVFCGVLLAFAFCCWSGHRSAQQGCFRKFQRFHQLLTPESMFFPTISMARQYVLHHVSRRQILVIVGGDSVFNGTGQSIDELWTRRLEAQLGPEYRVVNFAFRGGRHQEVGLAIAESLAKIYPKMIFLVGTVGQSFSQEPDGFLNKYFYWDAHYKGLLMDYPARRDAFATLPDAYDNYPLAGSRVEIRRGAWLDSKCYFNDLWNSLAYSTVSTPWNFIAAGTSSFYAPRQSMADGEPRALPPAAQYSGRNYEAQIRNVPRYANSGFLQDAKGDWQPAKDYWDNFRHHVDLAFPPALRPQMLVMMARHNPHFIDMLSQEGKGRYDYGLAAAKRQVESLGLRVLDPPLNTTPEDFSDIVHLSGSGGEKMAEIVAPAIRQMAAERNYLPPAP